MKPSAAAPARSESPGNGGGGVLRRMLRGVLLILVLVLVAGIGLVIGRQTPEPQLSASEQALVNSAASADDLAAAARSIAGSAAADEAGSYATLAELLELHAAALRPAASAHPTRSPDASPVTQPAAQSPPAAAEAKTAPEFLADLTASFTAAFAAAATVEAGPARLLASVGTSQWLQARTLAKSLGVEAPPEPVADMEYDDDAPACAQDEAFEAEEDQDGTRSAVLAEHRTAYAYQVVAARSAEPEPYLSGVAGHESAAAVGSAILADRCVAEPLPAGAYALDRLFLTEPDAALQNLEQALVGTYADLVGVSAPGAARDWAITRLTETAQRSAGAAGGAAGLGKFPGIHPSLHPKLPDVATNAG
ncbi:hypothetical protein GCM10027403_25700 [Arthrobacter tecti]